MPNCKKCGKSVISGIVMHDRCYGELLKENEELKARLEKSAELPCKLGNTVYELVNCDDGICKIFEMKVCNMSLQGFVYKDKIWNIYLEDDHSKSYVNFCDFGKTVFTAKAEAEKALKERESR